MFLCDISDFVLCIVSVLLTLSASGEFGCLSAILDNTSLKPPSVLNDLPWTPDTIAGAVTTFTQCGLSI